MRALEITVRELRLQDLEDYLRFFDEVYKNDPWLNSKDNPWWGICYCGFYDDTRTEQERNTAPDAATKNRNMRAESIQSRKAHGLLAYVDGKVVGWCNAGPRASYQNLRNLVPDRDPTEPVGSILCFVVAASFRGQRIATTLLNAACGNFRRDGLRIAEGYPRTIPPHVNNPYNIPPEHLNYRGSLSTFLKAGFTIYRQLERHAIVRKQL